MSTLNPYMIQARITSRLGWIMVRARARREAARAPRPLKWHLIEAVKRWLMFSAGTVAVILIGTATSPQVMSWW